MMPRIIILLLMLLVGVGAAWFALDGGGGRSDSSLQLAEGQKVYAEHCASCHGAMLEGQPNWRTPLATGGLPAPPHDESGHTWHHPDQVLFNYTKRGGQAMVGARFQSNMPAFGDTLSDDQIWAVLDFIKSRWPQDIQARQAALSASSS